MTVKLTDSNKLLAQQLLAEIKLRFQSPPSANKFANDLLEVSMKQMLKQIEAENLARKMQTHHD